LDTLALRTERQSARVSKIKNDGLDQYDAEPFEQKQFGTAGIEGVNTAHNIHMHDVVLINSYVNIQINGSSHYCKLFNSSSQLQQ